MLKKAESLERELAQERVQSADGNVYCDWWEGQRQTSKRSRVPNSDEAQDGSFFGVGYYMVLYRYRYGGR